ncbi:MAG: bioY [Haloplasmataceae bacterium]|jgi:biotin transport system substrate-specific component|nr:bioY [Haloplasmataceae bacterium]
MNIKQMTRISLFTAMMVVFTIVVPSIPFPIIQTPFTLQTLIIMLAAVLLKPTDAFMSILVYVMIGAIGLPVFSGAKGGLGVVLGPTGGFILAFPFAAFLISYFKGKRSFFRLLTVNIIFGIIFVSIFGVLTLSIYFNQPYIVMVKAMLILIIFDLIKALVASYIGIVLKDIKYLNV